MTKVMLRPKTVTDQDYKKARETIELLARDFTDQYVPGNIRSVDDFGDRLNIAWCYKNDLFPACMFDDDTEQQLIYLLYYCCERFLIPMSDVLKGAFNASRKVEALPVYLACKLSVSCL